MNRKEIEQLEKSILDARKALDSGLILDQEARGTLYRMMIYYQEKIDRERANSNGELDL